MNWIEVLPGLRLFHDSCNVYAVNGPAGAVIVNAGTGRWLAHLDQLEQPPVALVCTHYFRDHSAGAAAAAHAGIPVYVPEGERTIFADPVAHFQRRETYLIYDNLWDLFAPIEPTPVAGVLRDYERIRLGGLDVEIIPLPGVTVMQIGLALSLRERRLVFCGEAIHSPGRLARIAPLQYNYNDLSGALGCHASAQRLRECRPDALLPSLGEPMLSETDAALEKLQESLRGLCAIYPGMNESLDAVRGEPLLRITDHVWRDTHSVANTHFLISDSGKALAIDYGYDLTALGWPAYSRPEHRRALLHGLDGLKKRFGIERVDVVLASHFHDDHVCGIPVLQRLHGTQCWAAENFADLLVHPEAHCFPCTWPVPIRVDRRLPLDAPFQWEEYTFHLHAMSGHTRFATLIGFEADGKRFAHTGDQYFFVHDPGKEPAYGFANNQRRSNHVYRNGALLDGYDVSGRWLHQWRPDLVLQGHQQPFVTDEHFFRHISEWSRHYRDSHQRAMVLGDAETHFNVDGWGGWIWPYRIHLKEPGLVSVRVTVRNPFPRRATLEVRLMGPKGWQGGSAVLTAEARTEVSCQLQITPSGLCRRQPFAAELVADGQPFGQVAEALMTVGGLEF